MYQYTIYTGGGGATVISHRAPNTLEPALAAPGTHHALFVDDTCIYATGKHERRVLCKLQRGLTAVNSWCERWNIKMNEGKPQAISLSRSS
jgi:hypothetical protein